MFNSYFEFQFNAVEYLQLKRPHRQLLKPESEAENMNFAQYEDY